MNLISIFILINTLLATGIAVTAFSLLLYVVRYNWSSPVARAFAFILAGTMIVFTGDTVLPRVTSIDAAEGWLRFQWIGIALAPAAYLHFADEVLRTTNAVSLRRRRGVYLGYAYAVVFAVAALFTDRLVQSGGSTSLIAPRLAPGAAYPWVFPTFVAYFAAAVGFGFRNIVIARQRCLTPTSQRRMTYLLLSSTVPSLGVFPYLLIAGQMGGEIGPLLWLVLIAGNATIGVMLVVMAYSVAYFGVLAPDRVVKRRLVRFLLRGPVTAGAVVTAILIFTRLETLLNLPNETLMIGAVVITVVVFAVLRGSLQPLIDLLVFRQDRNELEYIEQIGERLLTTTDLQQFLENVLTSVCDLLRAQSAFIASRDRDDRWEMLAVIGALPPAENLLSELRAGAPATGLTAGPYRADGFECWPLYARGNGDLIGALAITAGSALPELGDDELAQINRLIRQAVVALDDRRLQEEVFAAVEQILPEIDVIQRQRGAPRYVDSPPQPALEETLGADPEFIANVKDALSHFWGGPKLTTSPLLRMAVVDRATNAHNGNTSKALRAVLGDAIEQLRPDGPRSLTAAEWVLYNILELRFLQGERVRDIARKLAMSESDLYRKQRVAVEAVARVLAQMEQRVTLQGDKPGAGDSLSV
ncbi:MAG TPA: histidine kinase N-terminal 7TM domain-containing protein [Anaerolineae bacterium]|nr:histidine kinase N-terminal 7TM domain-containing protein [Anaerolineae bacterium]